MLTSFAFSVRTITQTRHCSQVPTCIIWSPSIINLHSRAPYYHHQIVLVIRWLSRPLKWICFENSPSDALPVYCSSVVLKLQKKKKLLRLPVHLEFRNSVFLLSSLRARTRLDQIVYRVITLILYINSCNAIDEICTFTYMSNRSMIRSNIVSFVCIVYLCIFLYNFQDGWM